MLTIRTNVTHLPTQKFSNGKDKDLERKTECENWKTERKYMNIQKRIDQKRKTTY